jgi:hypothetical protein
MPIQTFWPELIVNEMLTSILKYLLRYSKIYEFIHINWKNYFCSHMKIIIKLNLYIYIYICSPINSAGSRFISIIIDSKVLLYTTGMFGKPRLILNIFVCVQRSSVDCCRSIFKLRNVRMWNEPCLLIKCARHEICYSFPVQLYFEHFSSL